MKRFFIFLVFSLLFAASARADQASELRQQIGARQSEIEKLDEIIAEQEKQLASTAKQASTLQGAVDAINLSIKKLNNQISKTEAEIKSATLKLEELNLGINRATGSIEEHEIALRQMMRDLAEQSQESLPELLVRYRYFSDFLAAEDQTIKLQETLSQSARELKELKTDLGVQVVDTEQIKTKLLALKGELADQQKIAAAERTKQQALLASTKNQEASYQQQLAESRARREAFARELADFESQLKLVLDPSSLPSIGKGVLAWPVDNPFLTQQFGQTADAKRLYASGTHNGIDLRASVGTPIKSAAAGVVAGTGDTDTVCRGASYGKWVLIKHDNGLATLSAHLSLVKVSQGQRVGRGELIGYSGMTGYATGPHLHFTVAAADGVQIQSLKSKVCPGTYVMPIFDTRAYLDPVLYL